MPLAFLPTFPLRTPSAPAEAVGSDDGPREGTGRRGVEGPARPRPILRRMPLDVGLPCPTGSSFRVTSRQRCANNFEIALSHTAQIVAGTALRESLSG